jgi:hypothetical protein
LASRPAEDFDPEPVRIEHEDRVVALNVAVLLRGKVNLVATRQAALVSGIDLCAAVHLKREVLDSYRVVMVSAAVGCAESEVRPRPGIREIDDLLGGAVGGIASLLRPSERPLQGEVEPQQPTPQWRR